MTMSEQLAFGAAVPAAGCTPFPDGRLCADPECTYGGAHEIHYCKELGAVIVRRRPHEASRVQWRLEDFKIKTTYDLRAAWDRLAKTGYVDQDDGDGWHHALAHLRHRNAGNGRLAWHGRCRSGQRWFWFAAVYGDHDRERHCDDPVCLSGWADHEHGWADTEESAINAMSEAKLRLTGRDPRWNRTPGALAQGSGEATGALKRINSAKRKARPPRPGASRAAVVEYLYEPWTWHDDYGETSKGISGVPIVKKTARRIYYDNTSRGDDVVTLGFIDRQDFEADTRCRDNCPIDVPVLVCTAHQRDGRHCVHYREEFRYPPAGLHYGDGCGEDCPRDVPAAKCGKHGRTWEHCSHGCAPDNCSGYPAGQGRRPGGAGWYHSGGMFFATRAAAEDYLYRWERERARKLEEAGPELKRLRMEMADAHPDRGGTSEGFIAARKRYEEACRRTS